MLFTEDKNMMKDSFKTGIGFGITSGVITTLGLMIGLSSGTESVLAVVGGVLTIAIADAFSDSLGVHVAKEFENKHTTKEIWESTLTTLLSKFFVATTFMIPLFIFSLQTAVIISTIWGLLLLGCFSYIIAMNRKVTPWHVVSEHMLIAIVVIIISHYVGFFIRNTFI